MTSNTNETADDRQSSDPTPAEEAEPNPLAGMRVRDVRKVLNDPNSPLYPAAYASAQRALKPLLESQDRWSKILAEHSTAVSSFASSKAALDILSNATSSIDTSVFTEPQRVATQKFLESIPPSIQIGEQFSKIASELASQTGAIPDFGDVLAPPYTRAYPESRFLPEKLDADDLTIEDVSEQAAQRAELDDRVHGTLVAIADAIIGQTESANQEVQRQIEVERSARESAEQDRKASRTRYWVGTVIFGSASLIGVYATLLITIIQR